MFVSWKRKCECLLSGMGIQNVNLCMRKAKEGDYLNLGIEYRVRTLSKIKEAKENKRES